MDDDAFTALVDANVPTSLRQALMSAIDNAEEPPDDAIEH